MGKKSSPLLYTKNCNIVAMRKKNGSSVKYIDEVFAVAVGCGEKTKPIALGIEAYFIGC